jgi:chemotaxis protein MotA
MFSIIGIVVVIGAVIGGYLMEHGNLKVLIQPAELVIIGGAALGTLLIGNPLPVIIKIVKGILGILGSGKYNKNRYLDTLKMLNDVFTQGKKGGMVSLETHVEEPDKSDLFKKHEFLHKDHHALVFICDTLRMALSGTVSHFDLDQMIDVDLEVHHKEVGKPVSALTTVADSLPGLGIVAAVLGVVITMGSLGGPPEEIGHKVAAALVGTFLGILLCYGFWLRLRPA